MCAAWRGSARRLTFRPSGRLPPRRPGRSNRGLKGCPVTTCSRWSANRSARTGICATDWSYGPAGPDLGDVRARVRELLTVGGFSRYGEIECTDAQAYFCPVDEVGGVIDGLIDGGQAAEAAAAMYAAELLPGGYTHMMIARELDQAGRVG